MSTTHAPGRPDGYQKAPPSLRELAGAMVRIQGAWPPKNSVRTQAASLRVGDVLVTTDGERFRICHTRVDGRYVVFVTGPVFARGDGYRPLRVPARCWFWRERGR